MLFNSYYFILGFFPVVFCVYFLLNHFGKSTYAKAWLTLASLYFYSYFKLSYLPIIVASILVNYIIGQVLLKTRKKSVLILGIIFNLGILGFFKYLSFVTENINFVFGTKLPVLNILLPLGISFYTFQQFSYIVDCYNGKGHNYSFLDYSLFVTFFPQLIAGPIVLAQEMLPQFESTSAKKLNFANMNTGFLLFAIGLAKKCFLADSFAVMANVGFDSTTTLTFAEAWCTSLAYTLQLYFDFSGYCDMAMGIGKFFNIDLPLNFDSPYKSTDFQSFWRRWHMTLSRFMMNYLYIPLGGNRKGEARTYLNLLVVFIASGIWHGAGWLFLLWGLAHGVCILIHRLWKKRICGRHLPAEGMPNFIAIPITFLLVNCFWVLFRATSLKRAVSILRSMLNFANIQGLTRAFKIAAKDDCFAYYQIIALMVLGLFAVFFLPNSVQLSQKIKNPWCFSIATAVIFVTGFLFVNRITPFLYFNF